MLTTVALLAAGIAVLVVLLVDVVWTTVAAGSGGGPVTSRVTTLLWRFALRLVSGPGPHRRLAVAGVLVVVSVPLLWTAMALVGWALVFFADPSAVVSDPDGVSASFVERLYFVGFTVFTLGVGDFRPGPGGWQLATVVATGSGLVLVTMAVTYLVPVASAEAKRRHIATTISSLGSSDAAIVCDAWSGRDFAGMDSHLSLVASDISESGQQLLAYPVLHYLHSVDERAALSPQLLHLHGALLLLAEGVAPGSRPPPAALTPARRAVGSYLVTLDERFLTAGDDPTPAPSLAPLRAAGIPTVDDSAWAEALAAHDGERRILASLLRADGWSADVDA
jgi:hypothetical protein